MDTLELQDAFIEIKRLTKLLNKELGIKEGDQLILDLNEKTSYYRATLRIDGESYYAGTGSFATFMDIVRHAKQKQLAREKEVKSFRFWITSISGAEVCVKAFYDENGELTGVEEEDWGKVDREYVDRVEQTTKNVHVEEMTFGCKKFKAKDVYDLIQDIKIYYK